MVNVTAEDRHYIEVGIPFVISGESYLHKLLYAMKIMRKALLVLSLFAFLFGIAACEEPTTELTDQEKVDAVKDALVLEGDLSAVTENLMLPETGDHGVTIEWSSSNTNVVSLNGTVNRGEENVTVTLTATITLNDATATKEFEVTVLMAEDPVIDLTQFLNLDFSEGLEYWDFTGSAGNLTGVIRDGGPGETENHVELSVNRTLGNAYDAKFRQRNKTLEPGVYQLSFQAKASDDFGLVELTFGSFGSQSPAKEIYPMKNIPTDWTLFDQYFIEITEEMTDVTIEFGVGLGNPNGKTDPADDTIPSTKLYLADVTLEPVDTYPGWIALYPFENLDFASLDGWDVLPYGDLGGRITPVLVPGTPNQVDITLQNLPEEPAMAARWDAKFRQNYVSMEGGVYHLTFEAKVDDPEKFNELYVFFGGTRVTFTDLTNEFQTFEIWVDATAQGNTHKFMLEFDLGLGLANPEDVIVVSLRGIDIVKEDALPDDILVQNAFNALDLGNTLNISGDVTLPTEAAGGVSISWSSTDEAILSSEGVFTEPAGSALVTLTATITKGDAELTKDFVYEWISVTITSYVIEEELLTNGDLALDEDTNGIADGFEIFLGGTAATGTLETDDTLGAVQKVTIDSGNSATWNLKYRQTGLTYNGEAYQASFWANISAEQNIRVVMGSPSSNVNETILLRTGWHFYVVTLAAPAQESARLEFELGGLDTGTEVWFASISLGIPTEYLVNGDFSDPTDPKLLWQDLDANTTSQVIADDTYGQVAMVTMINNSNEFYHRKFRQSDLVWEAGNTYVITFDVKADQEDQFRFFAGEFANGMEGAKYVRAVVDVTTDWQTVTVVFSPTVGSSGSAARLEFEIGKLINGNNLYIADVSVKVVDTQVTE
jgi:hypothetical protein